MACLKMILAARSGVIHRTHDLLRTALDYGAYRCENGIIRGLIYAPFVEMIRREFGVYAEIVTNIHATKIPALLAKQRLFIASVHPAIRRPENHPPRKGGHLVLVTQSRPGELRFHNPSGHVGRTQCDARLDTDIFELFFRWARHGRSSRRQPMAHDGMTVSERP
ncbi:hypothetical protein BI364_16410 [Acidihalobacter yilgarnensis]|uniref:Peptidase C39-like domain-containing protein n=1 Tax=Acidihalobacter yilgarnensis TaxID=2819280 RepID=A0A1D8IS13_9GAMM|nr:hypothetical protein [Acidihalobacter yilgarnensis]AOU99300.1 hypothetical protein BI364_16410 [Acidihalobacter yilgarnensis]